MKYFDYSHPFFLPVCLEETAPRIHRLTAGGESVELHGDLFRAHSGQPLEPRLQQECRDYLVFSLWVKSGTTAFLESVAWFVGDWHGVDERCVHSTELLDNALFLRKGGVSFFLSLDFPYSKITDRGISYPAQEKLVPGVEHSCHSLTVGACALSGIKVGDFDRAEIEAFSRYVETRFPPRFERPVFLTEIIANRMTECGPTGVFYSLHDNPTIHFNPDLLKRDIQLYADIGVEFCQIFENQFDWPDPERDGRTLEELVRFARKQGIRLGSWVSPHHLHCSGFFDYNGSDDYDFPERRRLGNAGKSNEYCLGCDAHLHHLLQTLVGFARKYDEEIIDFDFLSLAPCYNPAHGHALGDVYRQVLGLVKVARALAEVSPHYLVWSNLGWSELAPKIAWVNPSMYLTDPHTAGNLHGLNQHKIASDTRRLQMVGAHNRYFLPYRFFTNYEYYLFPRNRIGMARIYEYAFLQGLAVTPNIGLGELRPFLNGMPHEYHDAILAFMRKWLGFIKANFNYWKQTFQVDNLAPHSSVEIYAHTLPDSGYVCLVNPAHYSAMAAFALDGTIGLSEKTDYELAEVYPRDQRISEQGLPYTPFGSIITCRMQPYSVRYIYIAPAERTDAIKVYGPCRKIEKRGNGYRLTLQAPQGTTQRVGLVLPPKERLSGMAVRQKPTVKRYTFPVHVERVDQAGNLAWLDVTFPRQPAPDELRRWRLNGKADLHLPADNCPFWGGLISGAFSEDYEVELDIEVAADSETRAPTILPPKAEPTEPVAVDVAFEPGRPYTFEAEFVLPFIEWEKFSRDYGDDAVVYLAFADPEAIGDTHAWLNDVPVEVGRYPVNGKSCRFIELAGQAKCGPNALRLEVAWNA